MPLSDREREIGSIPLLYGPCDEVNLFPWVFMGGVCNSHAIKRYRKIRLFAGLFRVDMDTPDSETSITTVLERLIKV